MIQDKMVVKGVSVKASQVEKVGQFVDLSRHGQWSQFIQDAIDLKLENLERRKAKQDTEKLAS
jgi:hypothetical protein